MSSLAHPAPVTSSGIRWTIADSWAITLRAIQQWIQQPGAILIGLLFPIMMVLMNAYIYGGSIQLPGGGDYTEFLMPGMFALTMMFGLESTAITMHTDSAKGVTDRFRAMPMAPSAVVLGRSIADLLYSAAQLVIMVACGLVVGWTWHEGLAQAVAALGLLLLLRFAFVWVGVYLGLVLKTPEAVSGVSILVWPFGMLSNVFVAPQNMPRPLEILADWNPLSSTALAVRDLCGNPGLTGGSWIADNSILMAFAWPIAIVAIFLPLSVRTWRALGS
jgi:ABC transporter DrrB family efflux protein